MSSMRWFSLVGFFLLVVVSVCRAEDSADPCSGSGPVIHAQVDELGGQVAQVAVSDSHSADRMKRRILSRIRFMRCPKDSLALDSDSIFEKASKGLKLDDFADDLSMDDQVQDAIQNKIDKCSEQKDPPQSTGMVGMNGLSGQASSMTAANMGFMGMNMGMNSSFGASSSYMTSGLGALRPFSLPILSNSYYSGMPLTVQPMTRRSLYQSPYSSLYRTVGNRAANIRTF